MKVIKWVNPWKGTWKFWYANLNENDKIPIFIFTRSVSDRYPRIKHWTRETGIFLQVNIIPACTNSFCAGICMHEINQCFVIAGEHTSRVSRRIQDIKYNCNYKYIGHLEHDWHTHTHTGLLIYSMEKGNNFIWIRHCFKMSLFYIMRWRNNQSSTK